MRSVLPLLVVLATIGCKKEVAQPTTLGTDDDPTSGQLDIDILHPEAGAHLPVGTVTVEGTQTGLNTVTLNAEPIEATSGTFSRDIELERGINNIDARGEKGTTFRLSRRAVLAGTFAEPFGPIDEALDARARGWAVFFGVIFTLDGHESGGASVFALGLRVLGRLGLLPA